MCYLQKFQSRSDILKVEERHTVRGECYEKSAKSHDVATLRGGKGHFKSGGVNCVIFLVKYPIKCVTSKSFKAVVTFERGEKNSRNDEKTQLSGIWSSRLETCRPRRHHLGWSDRAEIFCRFFSHQMTTFRRVRHLIFEKSKNKNHPTIQVL